MSQKTDELTVFETLNNINVNEKTEKKGDLTYLSWAWAWAEVKKAFPSAHYEIWKDEQNRPYIHDPELGYMVFTRVAIMGQEHEMWLPVMDSRNKALKTPTMTDINKTIMRCLTKNLAMFGLGLYIYAGEDLPEEEKLEIDRKAAEKSLKMMHKVIADEAKKHEAPLEKWLEHYGVSKVEDLNAEQAVKIINTLRERYGEG